MFRLPAGACLIKQKGAQWLMGRDTARKPYLFDGAIGNEAGDEWSSVSAILVKKTDEIFAISGQDLSFVFIGLITNRSNINRSRIVNTSLLSAIVIRYDCSRTRS